MLINNFTNHIHQIWFQEGDLNELWNGIGSGDTLNSKNLTLIFVRKTDGNTLFGEKNQS